MTTTSVKINLDLGSGGLIKEGSSASISDVFAGCDLTDLATGLGVARKWATLEPDSWLLDGSYHLLDAADNNIGVLSGTVSDTNGDFSTPPELRIDFDDDYDLDYAISFYFSEVTNDYCVDIDIDFYDVGDSLLDSQSFVPDDYTYVAEIAAVTSVRYIIITFNTTNRAFRHLRLTDIAFDSIVFSGSDVKDANIVEEISPIAVETPSNSLEFTIHSDDDDFSIIDPQALYASLERHQKIDVYELIDSVSNYMGRFYLEEWNSENDKLASFRAVDALQILGTIPYVNNGNYFAADGDFNFPSHTLEEFFEFYFNDDTGFEFEVDSSLLSQSVDGWVPLNQTCRDVLQNICFALGAYITCSRSNVVQIKPIELAEDLTAFDYLLTNANMANRDIKQVPLVTGIKLTAHHWQDNTESFSAYQIYDDSIAVGSYKFLLPADLLMIGLVRSGTATVSSHTLGRLYWEVNISGAGTLDAYVDGSKKHLREEHSQAVTGLPTGTPENIIEITDAYFVTPDNVDAVMQRLIDYYSQKYELTAKMFASEIAISDSVLAQTQKDNKYLTGIVEKSDIDLAGGFVSSIKARGNVETVLLSGNKYNQDYVGFIYDEFINTNLQVDHYEGDIQYSANGEGGSITFRFIGTQFVFVYRQLTGGLEGSVTITVDGVLIDTIDQNGSTIYQQEWTSPVLANTYHHVVIAKVGTTGTANIDAVEIL